MKEYFYDEVTGEYTGSGEVFMDGNGDPLVSANATLSRPPKTIKHQSAVFFIDSWKLLADYRGYEYYRKGAKWNDDPVKIEKIGVKPPAGHTVKPPPKPREVILKENIEACKAEVKRIIEAVAVSYGYDSAVSMRSYFDGTNSDESIQAKEYTEWTRGVWRRAYGMMAGGKLPEIRDIKRLIGKPVISGSVIDKSVYPFD